MVYALPKSTDGNGTIAHNLHTCGSDFRARALRRRPPLESLDELVPKKPGNLCNAAATVGETT